MWSPSRMLYHVQGSHLYAPVWLTSKTLGFILLGEKLLILLTDVLPHESSSVSFKTPDNNIRMTEHAVHTIQESVKAINPNRRNIYCPYTHNVDKTTAAM